MEYFNIINTEYKKTITSKILTPCVKVELIDWEGRAYKEIIQDLSSENGGSISATFQNGVQRSISLNIFDPNGEFIPNPNDRLVWIGQRFKVYLGLRVSKTNFPLSILDGQETQPAAYSGDRLVADTEYALKKMKNDDNFYWCLYKHGRTRRLLC